MKKTLLILFCSVLIGLGLVAYFDSRLDPEKVFFAAAQQKSDAWAERLSKQYPHKYVLAGGSSSRTAINPAVLMECYGIPLVNAGYHAGFGSAVNLELALSYLKQGDTLIVSLEADTLTGPEQIRNSATTSGLKFLTHYKHPVHGDTDIYSIAPDQYTTIARGDTATILLRLLKPLISDELYRYSPGKHLTETGWMNVNHNWMKCATPYDPSIMIPRAKLNTGGRRLLTGIRDWCQARGIHIVYSIPRALWENNAQTYYAILALDILKIMPVLRDPALGVNTNPHEFADTVNHLNQQGATDATIELGRELEQKDYWTREQLLEHLHRQGLDEHGHRLAPQNVRPGTNTLP